MACIENVLDWLAMGYPNYVYDQLYIYGLGSEGFANYIAKFDWPTNVWIRFVIRSWLDEKKNTYVGNWIQNLETKEWTLYSYFNTNLINSYITGGLSQFQENYNANYFGEERSFRI